MKCVLASLGFKNKDISYCLDKSGDEIAKGGATYFEKGKINKEIPAGSENYLFVEI